MTPVASFKRRHLRAQVGLIGVLVALAHGAEPERAQSSGRPSASPGQVDTLRSVAGLPPAIVGQFRDPLGFHQAAGGEYFVFDRRGHSVYEVDAAATSVRTLVQIGGEDGRIIEPRGFGLHPTGTFAVADAPNGRERIQFFGHGGSRLGGFFLPGRALARLSIGGLSLSGVGTLAFTGTTVLINQPETGALITEYTLDGTPVRSIGGLRTTGQESDRDVHLAMNASIPLVDPTGGFYVVFQAGTPMFRKYDAAGALVFERVMQGRELDPLIADTPMRWPRRTVNDSEIPLIVPNVRTAAVDSSGQLWVAFTIPFTYVFDERGEKIRTVQFRAGGIVSPTSLAFTGRGRLLVTPGCFEFEPR
ncbi:MAG: hypothetical protein LC791_00410 [Acidobacteria bacterium]|nr:hypothetical protein [Acidobacteriota bacterium]